MTTLVRRRQPSLNTLNVLLEVEPFPGPDPESKFFVQHSSQVSYFFFLKYVVLLVMRERGKDLGNAEKSI